MFLDRVNLLPKGFNLTLFYLNHFFTVIVGHIQAQFFDGVSQQCKESLIVAINVATVYQKNKAYICLQ